MSRQGEHADDEDRMMTDAETAVMAVAGRRAAALAAAEWSEVDALLHPDFAYTNAQGIRLDKGQYLKFLRGGTLRWHEQLLEEVAVVVDDDVAVLMAQVVDDVDVGGQRMRLRFATTQTYVRRGGSWSYLAGHTAPPPEQLAV